jgi:aspartate/tyrosine/aromatic aminotransferase
MGKRMILTKKELQKMKEWFKRIKKIKEEVEDMRYKMLKKMDEENRQRILSLDSWLEIIGDYAYRMKRELDDMVGTFENDYNEHKAKKGR